MKQTIYIILAVLWCNGCRQEERTATDYTEATEQSSTSAADTATRPMPIVPEPQDTPAAPQPSTNGSLSVQLTPRTTGRLSGNAVFKANGNSTIASVRLTFPAGAGTHEGVIHVGRCEKLGPTVTDLNPVSTDSLGVGRSASYIDIALDSLRAKPHALTYGKSGRPHSCGNIS